MARQRTPLLTAAVAVALAAFALAACGSSNDGDSAGSPLTAPSTGEVSFAPFSGRVVLKRVCGCPNGVSV